MGLMLIDGELRNSVSGATFSTINPATGEVLGDVPAATDEDVDHAAQAGDRFLSDRLRRFGRDPAALLPLDAVSALLFLTDPKVD